MFQSIRVRGGIIIVPTGSLERSILGHGEGLYPSYFYSASDSQDIHTPASDTHLHHLLQRARWVSLNVRFAQGVSRSPTETLTPLAL